MNICLHMTYILVKRSCIKMLLASGGIQPLFPAYVHSPEVTITTREGVTYRKTQAHFKPYKQQGKK